MDQPKRQRNRGNRRLETGRQEWKVKQTQASSTLQKQVTVVVESFKETANDNELLSITQMVTSQSEEQLATDIQQRYPGTCSVPSCSTVNECLKGKAIADAVDDGRRGQQNDPGPSHSSPKIL